MATYHFDLRTISRGRGQSAVAAAAYRSGETLTSEIDGERKQPRRNRADILHAELLNWHGTREQLWNVAEKSENRKNSMLAREIIVALPHELTHAERVRITRELAQEIADRIGVAVDLAVHRPPRGEQNHHAHILFTTRQSTGVSLGAKTREMDVVKSSHVIVRELRKFWETRVNQSLQGMSVAPVSCLPVRSRGEEPQRKLGPSIAGMMRRGIITEFEIRHTELAEAKAALAAAEAELAAKISVEKAAQDQANETANGHLQQRQTLQRDAAAHRYANEARRTDRESGEADRGTNEARERADAMAQLRSATASIALHSRRLRDRNPKSDGVAHGSARAMGLAEKLSGLADMCARLARWCRGAGISVSDAVGAHRADRETSRLGADGKGRRIKL